MKVKQLIALLENVNQEANVVLVCQPNWPLEYSLSSVITRDDILENDESDEGEETELSRGMSLDDVLLVEGSQLRYGSKKCFDF